MLMLYASLALAARTASLRLVRSALATLGIHQSEKEANMAREKNINLRVSQDEYAQLMMEAEKAGITVSTFVREAALRRKIKATPCKIDAEAWISLGKALNNLNQIARHINTEKRKNPDADISDEISEVKAVIHSVRQKIMEVMQ